MSLLQELKRDTQTLLNTTKATREELETFLKVTNSDLGGLLYSQSKYNQFVKWLQHNKAQKPIDQKLLFVNYAMIEYLQDKKLKGQEFSKGEMINCYAYNKETHTYILCVNNNGHCHVSNIDCGIEYLETYCRFIENILKQYNN